MSKCGTGATGIAAIGTADGTGITGTTARAFTSTSGRGGTIIVIGAVTIGVANLICRQRGKDRGRAMVCAEGLVS